MLALRSRFLAAFLSFLVPGLGQLYNGERAKGLTQLAVVVGMLVTCIAFQSRGTYVVIGIAYLAIWLPATVDAFRVANGMPSSFGGEKRWYVVAMLFVVGLFALPMLWQSNQFSRRAKIVWTIVVVLVALLYIVGLAFLGSWLDEFQRNHALKLFLGSELGYT